MIWEVGTGVSQGEAPHISRSRAQSRRPASALKSTMTLKWPLPASRLFSVIIRNMGMRPRRKSRIKS